MTITPFPHGISSFGVPILPETTPNVVSGNIYWVGATAGLNWLAGSNSSATGGEFQTPFATIDYAIGKCTANNGDVIYVLPGHTETISSAGAITCDIAGVKIIGLGTGSLRPKLTIDTAATSNILVSAANVTWKNIIFSANFADINTVFNLTTANYLTLDGCRFVATATNMNFLYIVDTNTTSNAVDGLKIVNCEWVEVDTADNTFIKMDGTNDGIIFINNTINLGVKNNTASIMAIITTKLVTNLNCGWNKVFRLNTDTATGGLLITTDGSTNSGWIYNNYAQHADTAAEIMVTASSGFGFFENRASGVAGATGYVLPAVDS